jgi:hypothetical protein
VDIFILGWIWNGVCGRIVRALIENLGTDTQGWR